MNQHPIEEQLNDFADGTSADDAVRLHVAGCDQCSVYVSQLRALFAEADALPESIEPPAELWGEIRALTIDARVNRAAVLRSLRVPLAAAALVLIASASVLTWYVTRATTPTRVVTTVRTADVNLVALRQAETDYLAATRTLLEVFEQRRAQMDPKVVEAVEYNLKIMNGAIEGAKAALASDPANQDVAGILAATYQSKVKMLRRAISASGDT